MDILDDMGVSKLSAKVVFFLKVNYSFNPVQADIIEYVTHFAKTNKPEVHTFIVSNTRRCFSTE